jgi:hypothetical protein
MEINNENENDSNDNGDNNDNNDNIIDKDDDIQEFKFVFKS